MDHFWPSLGSTLCAVYEVSATARFRLVQSNPNHAISISAYSKKGCENQAIVRVAVPVTALRNIFLLSTRSSNIVNLAIPRISLNPAFIRELPDRLHKGECSRERDGATKIWAT
jgi:hypothetical protein